jgi:hypothetical protein
MKVLSLLQPWASLVVMGAKLIETRSWNTDYTGDLAIHASLGKHYGKGLNKRSCREICYKEPFKHFIPGGMAYDKLPFGAIIGRVDLFGTTKTENLFFASPETKLEVNGHGWYLTNQEIAFGDYTEGRYGLFLANAVQYLNPISAKGQLGLWDFQLPYDFQPQFVKPTL